MIKKLNAMFFVMQEIKNYPELLIATEKRIILLLFFSLLRNTITKFDSLNINTDIKKYSKS